MNHQTERTKLNKTTEMLLINGNDNSSSNKFYQNKSIFVCIFYRNQYRTITYSFLRLLDQLVDVCILQHFKMCRNNIDYKN